MPGELCRCQPRDGSQIDPRIAVDTVFESHNQAVVQNAVDENWPTGQRSITKAQIAVYQPEEFMKDDMNNNCVSIPAIDSRRKNQIKAKPPKLLLIPAKGLVGEIPPEKIYQMRGRQRGTPVPDRFSGSRGRNRGSLKSNNFKILDGLGVNMDLEARMR